MKTLEQIIYNLKPSHSEVISQCNGITCSVERSGDGKTLRFIREYKDGRIVVFKKCDY